MIVGFASCCALVSSSKASYHETSRSRHDAWSCCVSRFSSPRQSIMSRTHARNTHAITNTELYDGFSGRWTCSFLISERSRMSICLRPHARTLQTQSRARNAILVSVTHKVLKTKHERFVKVTAHWVPDDVSVTTDRFRSAPSIPRWTSCPLIFSW